MSNPLISVVMSNYNGLPFLEEAVCSILNQTESRFEFIIIDDCSADDSRKLLRTFSDSDNRIRLIENHVNCGRAGLGINLAKGVSLAKGKYVARMDSDDISIADRFERQILHLEANPQVDVLGTWAVNINEHGEELDLRKYPTSWDDLRKIMWTCPLIHPSVMFRREAILRIGNYSPHSGRRDDYELWFRATAAGLVFENLPYIGLKYRFYSDFFQKNDLRVAYKQFKIGLKGCRMLHAPLRAYLAIAFPLLRSIFPRKMNIALHKIGKRFDPRASTQ